MSSLLERRPRPRGKRSVSRSRSLRLTSDSRRLQGEDVEANVEAVVAVVEVTEVRGEVVQDLQEEMVVSVRVVIVVGTMAQSTLRTTALSQVWELKRADVYHVRPGNNGE